MTPLVLSLLLLALPVWAAPPTAYTLTDLGPALAPTMAPTGGLIAGSQFLPEQTAVVLAPTPTIIGTLPQGTFSLANGATTDAVCGYSGTGAFSLHTHAFRWTAAGGIRDLGTTGDPTLFSAATDCNEALSVGYGDDPTQTRIVPLQFTQGQVAILPTPTPTGTGYALALNALNDSVGAARASNGETHAMLWPAAGGVQDLHTAPGTVSLALGINRHQQVVGTVYASTGAQGFISLPLTGMLLLPPLPGDTESVATSINDAGTVVGWSSHPLPETFEDSVQAVRYDNGVPLALLPLVQQGTGWGLESADKIDEDGRIVGTGTFHGEAHAYLLTPVPPPVAARHRPLAVRAVIFRR
jgi:hypothetical protein